MLRRALVLLAFAMGIAVATSPTAFAAGVPPCAPSQPDAVASAHFTVTFNDDTADPTAGPLITASQAGQLLAAAEQAYNAFVAMGYPVPLQSGGTTYIHVVDLTQYNLSSFNCPADINFDQASMADPTGMAYTMGFDVFEEIEFQYGGLDNWIGQGLASWAGWNALGYPASSTAQLGPWDMSLDCDLLTFTSQTCSTDAYTNLGESRWPFYEYLYEQYGNGFIRTLMTDDAAAPDGITGLQNALATESTTLGAAYGAFATKLVTAGWTAQQLNLGTIPVTGQPIYTGTTTADVPAQTFGVDHLATRFVEIDRGTASAPKHCYAATLTLKVAIPAGVTSQPMFYWAQAGSSPQPLTVSGQNATISVPWDTCTWKLHGYLSLPNPTTTVNGALFTVSGHLDVSTTEVTSTPPSTPANGYGNATDVSSTTLAPTISLFGPLLVSVPQTATLLQVVVSSNAQGSLDAQLGSLDLGRRDLVPGQNVLKYALPAGTLKRLRTSSAVANLLTLTPSSTDGTVVGKPVTMRIAVEPTAKPKPKAPKPKPRKK